MILHNLLTFQVMLKDATNALLDFERACKLSPYSAHIYFNRANLYMSLQMYEKAEEDYSRGWSLFATSCHNFKTFCNGCVAVIVTFCL